MTDCPLLGLRRDSKEGAKGLQSNAVRSPLVAWKYVGLRDLSSEWGSSGTLSLSNGVWWYRLVVLKVWSLEQHQHQLELVRNANYPLSLAQCWTGPGNPCFNKSSMWFWSSRATGIYINAKVEPQWPPSGPFNNIFPPWLCYRRVRSGFECKGG